MSIAEIDELILWLHNDIDHSLTDANDLQTYLKYQKMFDCLDLLKKELPNAN